MLGLRNSIEAAQTPEELAAAIAAAESSTGRWTVKSLGEVAAFFTIALSTAKGWSQEGMPNAGDGWSLPAIVRWRIARLANSDLATAQKQATLEATQLSNDARRLELSKERGELVELADVELWAAQALIKCRVQIMTIPEMVATSAPPELRDQLRAEADRTCRAALTTLRRDLERAELDKELTTGDVADGDESSTKKESTDEQDP